MADNIKLKRSATPGKVPQTTDLELGELAINTNDGKVYLKKDDGAEAIVEVGSGLGNVVEDTTPQLGGDLDTLDQKLTNSNDIWVNTDRRIKIDVGGTADTQSSIQMNSPSATGQCKVLFYNSADAFKTKLEYTESTDLLKLQHNGTGGLQIVSSAGVSINGLNYPTSDGTIDQVLSTDGSGNLSWADPATGGSGISNVVEDTTPQLGGDLDVNGQNIVSSSDGHIFITPDGTGRLFLHGLTYPNADGGIGQVIGTDGFGNLGFVDLGMSQLSDDTSPTLGGNLVMSYNMHDTNDNHAFGIAPKTAGATEAIYVQAGNDTTSDLMEAPVIGSTTDIMVKFPDNTYTMYVDGNIGIHNGAFITASNRSKVIEPALASPAVMDNWLKITATTTGNAPIISAQGVDTNLDLAIDAKGTGNVVISGLSYPNADGTADQVLKTDGAGNLSWTTISGVGDPSIVSVSVTQASHGFTTGDAIYYNGTAWVKAQADDVDTLSTNIADVEDANNFSAVLMGTITTSGLTAGSWYYCSADTAGALTTTEPGTGNYSNPVGQALSTTVLMVMPYRASEVA